MKGSPVGFSVLNPDGVCRPFWLGMVYSTFRTLLSADANIFLLTCRSRILTHTQVYYKEADVSGSSAAFYWRVHSGSTRTLSTIIQDSYEEFGTKEDEAQAPHTVGNYSKGACRAQYPSVLGTESDDACVFTMYTPLNAVTKSNYYRIDIENGCMASAEDQKHLSQESCNSNITSSTTDNIRQFNKAVHQSKFGLRLPVVRAGKRAALQAANDSNIDWIEGILPFYSVVRRTAGNSKDADFLGYLLDNQDKRCEDSYEGKSLREFACYFDANAKVQVVVPWLGKEYSFLKQSNRVRIQDGPMDTSLKRAEMGMDMCQGIEKGTDKIPCAATTCLPEIDNNVYNLSICKYSKSFDAYYAAELPNKLDLQYLERYHMDHNLFNPQVSQSQCYIKYTPLEKQLAENRQCSHTQAPIGYSPSQIRTRTQSSNSLYRRKVSIDPKRIIRDEFVVSKKRYSSLWSGQVAASVFSSQARVDTNAIDLVYALLAVNARQLSPSRVSLKIEREGQFGVSGLSLQKNETVDAINNVEWVQNMHTGVNSDIDMIARNPLYTNNCSINGCANRHWMCPFVLTSLFGGSQRARASNAGLQLITPDPVRMLKLYPELEGAHPLARSRYVASADIQEYLQFGPALFLENRDASWADNKLFFNEIVNILDFYVQGVGVKVRSKSPGPLRTVSMHWPLLATTLRSEETVLQHTDINRDMRAQMPSFWVKRKHRSMQQVRQAMSDAEAALPPLRATSTSANPSTQKAAAAFYTERNKTTLDAGGDCHRRSLAVINSQQLAIILASDVCFLILANATYRQLECSKRGLHDKQTLHLSTTHSSRQDATLFSQYLRGKKVPRACPAPAAAQNTTIHTWNPQQRKFTGKVVRDELSLSTRVRISPLWNMLARLGASTKYSKLTPQTVWVDSLQRRYNNPRWQPFVPSKADDGSWDRPWVFSNTDDQCKNRPFGSIAKKDWYGSPHKAQMCLDISQRFQYENPGCMQGIANSFNLCQIDKLKDFCFVISAVRAEIRQVNAWANRYTREYKNLYVPSRFLRQDGIFGWSAIVETYNTINPSLITQSSCPGVYKYWDNAATVQLMECPSDYIFTISKFVEKVRSIVAQIVRIFLVAMQLLTDVALFLLSVLTSDKSMQQRQMYAMAQGAKRLILLMEEYIKMMYGLVWDIVTSSEGVFKTIQGILTKLCEFAQMIVTIIVGALIAFFQAVSFLGTGKIVNSLKSFQVSVDSWGCKMLLDTKNNIDRNDEKMHASSCWLEQAAFSMPADFLGGRASEFACGPTSFCLRDVLSTESSMLCMQCTRKGATAITSVTGGYSCDLPTKQCVCGEKTMDPTPCLKTDECMGKNSICAVQLNIFSRPISSQLCSESVGASYCVKQSVSTPVGQCTTFPNDAIDTTPSCQSPRLAYPMEEIAMLQTLCVGLSQDIDSAAAPVALVDTFVFLCNDLTGSIRAKLKFACVRLSSHVSVQASRLSIVTYNTQNANSRFSRRLLSLSSSSGNWDANMNDDNENANDTGNSNASGLLFFFAQQSRERTALVPGVCGRVLQICILQENTATAMQTTLHNIYGEQSDCFYCLQTWWFFNYTLTKHTHSNVTGDVDPHLTTPSFSDVDFIDKRSMVSNFVSTPWLLPSVLTHTPYAIHLLLRDWLDDDEAFYTLVQYLKAPIHYADMLLYKILQHVRLPPATVNSFPYTSNSANPLARTFPTPLPHSPPSNISTASLTTSTPAPVLHADIIHSLSDATTFTDNASWHSRHLLQEQNPLKPYFDSQKFVSVQNDVNTQTNTLLNELAVLRAETYATVFDSTNGMSCVISSGTLLNDIVMSFATVLKKDGWSIKPVCSKQQTLDFSLFDVKCPLAAAPLNRVYENTLIIAEYYAYMMSSGCLANMSISCLRPGRFSAVGVIAVTPRLPQRNLSSPVAIYNEQSDLKSEQDFISYSILTFFYAASDMLSFDRSQILEMVSIFISMDALYSDHIYNVMVQRNEFTAGRLIRDLFDCNLRDTISCEKKSLSLLTVFAAVFLITLLVTVMLPVPSVIVFYLWTIGLLYGTMYLAYNFSPICTPRIPTCLGSGIYELSGQIMPAKIHVPRSLYNAQYCNSDLTLKAGFSAPNATFSCGKTCLQAPYHIDNIMTIIIACESLVRNGEAVWSKNILEQYGYLLTYDAKQQYLVTVTRIARQIHEDIDDFITGLYVCIVFNSYKVIAFVLVLVFAVPALLNIIISLFSFIIILIFKYTLITYNTDIYDNIT